MKHVVFPEPTAVRAELVIAATRCWRSARDAGRASTPPLHALLADECCPMLAAAFDSLLGLYEQALGRGLAIGWTGGLSEDEQLLANLLRGAGALPRCLAIAESSAHSFDCALCSTRILLALADEEEGSKAHERSCPTNKC